jgi:hypothetical protein
VGVGRMWADGDGWSNVVGADRLAGLAVWSGGGDIEEEGSVAGRLIDEVQSALSQHVGLIARRRAAVGD